MKIVILGSNPALYSTMRLMEAGKEKGHTMVFVNIKHCYMDISAPHPCIYYRGGKKIEDVDFVVPRIRPSLTFYGTAVVRQFEAMGVYCLNSSIAISRARDKLRTLQLLSRKNIDMPITGFAHSPKETNHLINIVGNAPLIIKLLEGTQGIGVVYAETDKAAESTIGAFKSLKANILVQEFIKEAEGCDIRCFVIGNKVVASMERRAAKGEFRANLHLGGKAGPIRITPTERKIAVKAAKIMGLKIAGVDLIRSKNGPKVLEINASPGLEGIEAVTNKDIARLIITYMEEHYSSFSSGSL